MTRIKVLLILLMVTSFFTSAEAEDEFVIGEIQDIETYTDIAFDGDLVIRLNSETNSCKQYWVKSDSKLGYKNVTSFILSSFHARNKIRLRVDPTQKWTGSNMPTCRVINVRVTK